MIMIVTHLYSTGTVILTEAKNIKITHYAKYFIYTHKIKGNNNFEFLGYLTYLNHVLKIEERICIAKHQEKAFAPLNNVLDSL